MSGKAPPKSKLVDTADRYRRWLEGDRSKPPSPPTPQYLEPGEAAAGEAGKGEALKAGR